MAINLASKYEKKVAERFKLKSLTAAGVNKEYDWAGVNSINVYSIPTVALGDYTASGSNRYGTPAELQNTIQTMTVSKDRSFTFTIDRKNYQDTQMAMEAGKALAREIDEVIIPEIDTYRIAAMATAAVAAGGTATAAVTASNAYAKLLAAAEYFGNNKVPLNGKICWCSYAYYSFIKQDSAFIKSGDLSQEMLVNGIVGMAEGMKIVPIPSAYLPANTAFVIGHPSATVAADKLEDYKTHDNPPGINGWLVEGRVRYDAFVLAAKNTAVYTHKIA